MSGLPRKFLWITETAAYQIEGAWQADPVALRAKFGRRLRMFGRFNKHLIAQCPAVIRQALERLKPVVDEGGFLPIPDHRIPPEVSLDQFRQYIAVYKEVFGA